MKQRFYNVYEFRNDMLRPLCVAKNETLTVASDIQRRTVKNPFVQNVEIVPADDDPYLAIFSSV